MQREKINGKAGIRLMMCPLRQGIASQLNPSRFSSSIKSKGLDLKQSMDMQIYRRVSLCPQHQIEQNHPAFGNTSMLLLLHIGHSLPNFSRVMPKKYFS